MRNSSFWIFDRKIRLMLHMRQECVWHLRGAFTLQDCPKNVRHFSFWKNRQRTRQVWCLFDDDLRLLSIFRDTMLQIRLLQSHLASSYVRNRISWTLSINRLLFVNGCFAVMVRSATRMLYCSFWLEGSILTD